MTLAIASDWGYSKGCLQQWELELPVKPVSRNSWFLVLQLYLLRFPLCEMRRITLSFSCALCGFCIWIARFSGGVMSFWSTWYHSTVTSGKQGIGRSQGYLSLLQWSEWKIAMYLLGLKPVNLADCNSFRIPVAIYKLRVGPGCGQLTLSFYWLVL